MMARERDEKSVQRKVMCWPGIICMRSKGREKGFRWQLEIWEEGEEAAHGV